MIKIYEVNKEQPTLLDQLNKKKSCGTVLIYSDHCPHCVSMKPQWEQMKQKMHNKPANIYEINSEDLPYINHPIKNVVDGFPMILNVNNREIMPFEEERTLDNFIRFVEKNIVQYESKRNPRPLSLPELPNVKQNIIHGDQIGNSLNLDRYIEKKLPLVVPKKQKSSRSKTSKRSKSKPKKRKQSKPKKRKTVKNKTYTSRKKSNRKCSYKK